MFDPTRDANSLLVDRMALTIVSPKCTDGTGVIIFQFTRAISWTPVNTTWKTEMGGMFDPIDANFFVSRVCFMLLSCKVLALQAAVVAALDTALRTAASSIGTVIASFAENDLECVFCPLLCIRGAFQNSGKESLEPLKKEDIVRRQFKAVNFQAFAMELLP